MENITDNKNTIAVIGDKDSIYCYAALGLDTYAVESSEEALDSINTLAKNNCAIIYLVERFAEQLSDSLVKYRDLPTPAIIPIPGVSGNTGYGMRAVKQAVEKAVGSDILGD